MNSAPVTAVLPCRRDGAVQQRVGRSEVRVCFAEPVPEQRVRRQRRVREHGHLAGCQCRDLGKRALGHPDRDIGELERGEGQFRDPAQGSVETALFEDAERAFFGNEPAVDREVVTAGAAQPGDRPRVDDLDLVRGDHHHPERRHAAVVDEAVGDEPVRVLASARERPSPVGAEPALDGRRHAGRIERSGQHDVGTFGVDVVERRAGACRGSRARSCRASRSTQPSRRRGRALASRACDRPPLPRHRRGSSEPAIENIRRHEGRRPGRAEGGGLVRSRRPAWRSRAPNARTASSVAAAAPVGSASASGR